MKYGRQLNRKANFSTGPKAIALLFRIVTGEGKTSSIITSSDLTEVKIQIGIILCMTACYKHLFAGQVVNKRSDSGFQGI